MRIASNWKHTIQKLSQDKIDNGPKISVHYKSGKNRCYDKKGQMIPKVEAEVHQQQIAYP